MHKKRNLQEIYRHSKKNNNNNNNGNSDYGKITARARLKNKSFQNPTKTGKKFSARYAR